jgi:hypothetical protein
MPVSVQHCGKQKRTWKEIALLLCLCFSAKSLNESPLQRSRLSAAAAASGIFEYCTNVLCKDGGRTEAFSLAATTVPSVIQCSRRQKQC